MSDTPYNALIPLLTQYIAPLPPLDEQQRLILNNINNFFTQDIIFRDRFFAWHEHFYNALSYELPRIITIPLNSRKSTGVTVSKNIFEVFCGYTSSNGFPLSADFSQTKIEISPEYYRVNVKNGPALHFQADVNTYPNTTVPISAIFYTDIVLDNYRFTVDRGTGNTTINSSTTTPALKVTQNGSGHAILVDSAPFVVDRDGKVGITTNSPRYKLDLGQTNGPAVSLWSNNSGIYGIGVANASHSQNATLDLFTYSNPNYYGTGVGLSGVITLGNGTFTPNFVYNETVRFETDTGNVGIGTKTPNQRLTVVGSTSATNRSTYQTYTNTGVQTSTSTSGLVVNAETVTRATWIANLCDTAAKLLQVSNLTDGREVFVYIKNTGTCGGGSSAQVTVQASTAASYSNVLCSNNGGTNRSTVTLASPNGAATVWVANIGGNIVGAIY